MAYYPISFITAFERKNVTAYCRDLIKILQQAEEMNEKLTPLKLIDSWMGKGATKLRVAGVAPPELPREDLEKIIAHFLLQQYLKYVQTYFLSFRVVFIFFLNSTLYFLNSWNKYIFFQRNYFEEKP